MHASSFFDLWVRYIYTPLYGPYSLSEALEGLVFYPLEESRDSVSIGSNRTLRHELVLELSNVVDDLQDYLVYFSSEFLIFPLNSPDLIKKLQASCDGFEHLSICWGAIITHLIIARKIVEHYFWPHLFQPTIEKLAALRRLKQPPSFVLPNMASDELPTPASALTSPSQIDGTPRTSSSPLGSGHLPLNVQSQRLQPTPSETDPMGITEGRASSLILDTTSPPSELHHTRISSNGQPPVTAPQPQPLPGQVT